MRLSVLSILLLTGCSHSFHQENNDFEILSYVAVGNDGQPIPDSEITIINHPELNEILVCFYMNFPQYSGEHITFYKKTSTNQYEAHIETEDFAGIIIKFNRADNKLTILTQSEYIN